MDTRKKEQIAGSILLLMYVLCWLILSISLSSFFLTDCLFAVALLLIIIPLYFNKMSILFQAGIGMLGLVQIYQIIMGSSLGFSNILSMIVLVIFSSLLLTSTLVKEQKQQKMFREFAVLSLALYLFLEIFIMPLSMGYFQLMFFDFTLFLLTTLAPVLMAIGLMFITSGLGVMEQMPKEAIAKKYANFMSIGKIGICVFGIGGLLTIIYALNPLNAYSAPALGIIATLLLCLGGIGMAFLALSLPHRDQIHEYQNSKAAKIAQDDGYISMVKHILLCLFTFGIWYYIWVYKTTEYLNRTAGAEQYRPVTKLLLCMFVPFYSIYWFYKHGQKADMLTVQKQLPSSDMAILCTILSIFIPLLACVFLQNQINKTVLA